MVNRQYKDTTSGGSALQARCGLARLVARVLQSGRDTPVDARLQLCLARHGSGSKRPQLHHGLLLV